jgi:RNA polymerase sigma factor (sigma-70 family)
MPTAELNPLVPAKPPAFAVPGVRVRTSAPDTVLVRRTREGDGGSFETIFKRHHAPLLSYCRHMLGGRDEAEDALQQAFIKAHRALLGGSAPRELRPWLYAIARNCCLTAIAARRPTAQLEDRTPALGGLSEEVRRREDLRELVAGIGRLPEDQRSALLLAELDDLPHQTIATIVGCEVSKVKALIYQARSSLIADRDARDTSCRDIREQLSVAHGGELRRGLLRRHLKLCEGCRDFQLAVSAQRRSFAAVLPVLPSAGLAAAIFGHGAAHATGAASLGGTGSLASASGTGAGATATGTTAGGGTGLAATGTAASTAVGASAGGGTGIGALVGGGLVTKLAVGGAVAAMATAGAVTAHSRVARATPHQTTKTRLATVRMAKRRDGKAEIANSSAGLSSSIAQGSPTAPTLAGTLASGAGPASSAGAGSLAQLTGLGGAEPLLSATGTLASSAGTPASPEQLAGAPGQNRRTKASNPRTARETRAKHRAALRHRRGLRRRKARLRRLRAARPRTRRKAFHRKPVAVKPAVPPGTPAPVPAPRRKAHPTPTSATGATPAGSTSMGSERGSASKRRRPPVSTGTSSTGAASTGAGAAPGATNTGTGKAQSKASAGKPEGTSPVEVAGTGAGKIRESGSSREGEGTGESASSKTKTGSGEARGAGNGSKRGTSSAGKSSETAAGTSETTGAGTTPGAGAKASPKKHLVEDEQLPNL